MLNLKKLLTNILDNQRVYTTNQSNTARKNGGFYVWKQGKVACFATTGDLKSVPAGGYTTYVTLPEGYRPNVAYFFRVVNNTKNIIIRVNTDGVVAFYNYSAAVTSAENGVFCGSYIIA